ncbi:ABC transporter permease subunit [Roseobacter sp. HKCCD9010]|uniref:amino acid ABC transporter permease n=1 Tax=unclassified Roseobacter TaxID=196798 RepID=UPI001492DADD|nr:MULTISPECIES: amino acid ABC transporter permease [unclassified Roseobacter]MBF9049070.1 ABC transporter permease subunit [Rhodobacterales bacterium HKCCD4356]NNV11070.1 ABC transporter permease subunit [Roseobacter sp. HKCCD7357]NNV15254.1 ABC transporter permease subunit [Roseobacter sp. HKCCD8768]NNV24714.1 ABC transporter permease subunit [Roseobacter sp. HKCCD8192]NNV28970.1 ABC transporter permease subunit [Roseobacter sp. HKCCD9061]
MIPSSPPEREFPWWLLAVIGLGAYALWQVLTDDIYSQVLSTLRQGILITIFVTLIGFALAASMGMLLALASLSRSVILRQMARFYVEIIRGVPIIVLLLYVAFVFVPALVAFYNWLAEAVGAETIRTRDFPLLWRAIIALAIGYSAFIAEVFRAGLQSVERGQIEAAEALGMGRWLRFRFIIFPQAIRTILPPLGNDFVAMVKDSSLVSVLGVLDITQLGKVTAASNFRYFETYNVVALIYLSMTITLSILLRRLEQRMRLGQDRRT